MGKIATGGGEPRELVPARTYLGCVVGCFELGKQPGYNGGDPVTQYLVQFELHTRGNRKSGPLPACDRNGNVLVISDFLNFYLGSRARPSKLLGLAEAIEGRSFTDEEIRAGYDVEKLMDRWCQVRVVHEPNLKGVVKDKIGGYAALDPDEEVPTSTLDSHFWEIDPAAARAHEVPEFVPKFVADIVRKSREYGGGRTPFPEPIAAAAGGGVGQDDSDIPF